jgi:transcriptional regulator with XRE-family HTH domain
MSDVSQIDGSAVRLCREAQGWAINDLAARACLSVKQVRQIEEGGLSSFYSESVKLTAARKIAGLLQLSEAQLFGQVPPVVAPMDEETILFSSQTASASVATSLPAQAYAAPADKTPAASSGVHLIRSEALHILAQPPEMDLTSSPTPPAEEASHLDDRPQTPVQTSAAKESKAAADETSPSGNYFLKILVLFLVAIAVAALLRPKPVEPTASSPEASTGQSMTPPVAPAAGETAVPDTGTGTTIEAAPAGPAGQADVKPPVAASDTSPAKAPSER